MLPQCYRNATAMLQCCNATPCSVTEGGVVAVHGPRRVRPPGRMSKSRRVEDTAVRRVDVDVDVPRSGEASFSEFRRALRKATERS